MNIRTTRYHPHAKLLMSVAFGAALLGSNAAFADGTKEQVISILSKTVIAAGLKGIDQDDISGDDSKFTLSGVEFDTGKDGDSFTLEELTFIGAKPTADGGIVADEVDISGYDMSADKGGISAKTIKIMGFTLAPPARIKVPGASHFDRFEMTGIEAGDDKTTATVSYLLLTSSGFRDGVPHQGSLEIKGLDVPVAADNPQMADLAELGYKDVNIDATFKGSWDDKSGRLSLDSLSISAKDMGDVQLAFVLGGVTPDVLKQLQAAKNDSSAALGAMQAVSVASASLKITNASLFERLISQQAKKQGTTKDELLHQGTAMLPLLLTSVQNPAFEKKVVDAVTAFISSPHTLTLSVAPAQPLPVPQIIGVAGAAPQTLPDLLGADVTANK